MVVVVVVFYCVVLAGWQASAGRPVESALGNTQSDLLQTERRIAGADEVSPRLLRSRLG